MHRRVALWFVLLPMMSSLLVIPDAAGMNKAAQPERTVEAQYTRPAGALAGGFCNTGDGGGCVEFDVLPGERFISVDIEDALGTEVFATVRQDTDGDGMSDRGGAICGRSDKVIRIEPVREAPVRVTIWADPNLTDPFCTGGASFGTVTVTFTKRR